MVTQKKFRNAIGFHWVSVRRENWNHLPQIWTFYLDEHLFGQEENICATKDGMDKKKGVWQKVLVMQKHKRICY